ncbi:MAG: alpha amylase C-terminal domain-containing protein [Clostridia bacterium]|nr:alpha amylase C-terminal domain-containing protein [Clostridia bacterium]
MRPKILTYDPALIPYEKEISARTARLSAARRKLLGRGGSLSDFANGFEYFGIHPTGDGWVYREWAPGAEAMYLTGDFCGWELCAHPLTRLENGVWELFLPGANALHPGERIQAIVRKDGALLRRIPAYATRVVQDSVTYLWCAELDNTLTENFPWTDGDFRTPDIPMIYECHIGMACEEGRIGTYAEFARDILPRVKALGYNTLQIMAVMEHPYYASFGYQVSNFFAASSRYGTSHDLKALIDRAHSMGIAVLLDVVHSHAVGNEGDGLNRFDGTDCQYFHQGPRGDHSAWGTKLFDYARPEVMHFLLSNLKFWMNIFHFDGFRFDGVTSMLYLDHGLERAFTGYDDYFSENTDHDAITYLSLANELVHSLRPDALTVAEDMSGMPGMCLPTREGGIGFDFRLSMGVPDLWIKMIDDIPEEHWSLGHLWYELNQRRPAEKNIGYCESHDQALVGDKTILFRLCDAEMYTSMSVFTETPTVSRGVALHKMIRLITASLAGEGYLNFMGNEFGHPEWIDFPREGNGWSYHYCRRQWSLAMDRDLRYHGLDAFDGAMIHMLSAEKALTGPSRSLHIHERDKCIVYSRAGLIYAFNFHGENSQTNLFIPTHSAGDWEVLLETDAPAFGGWGNIDPAAVYTARRVPGGQWGFSIYLPARTAVVLRRKKQRI